MKLLLLRNEDFSKTTQLLQILVLKILMFFFVEKQGLRKYQNDMHNFKMIVLRIILVCLTLFHRDPAIQHIELI